MDSHEPPCTVVAVYSLEIHEHTPLEKMFVTPKRRPLKQAGCLLPLSAVISGMVPQIAAAIRPQPGQAEWREGNNEVFENMNIPWKGPTLKRPLIVREFKIASPLPTLSSSYCPTLSSSQSKTQNSCLYSLTFLSLFNSHLSPSF